MPTSPSSYKYVRPSETTEKSRLFEGRSIGEQFTDEFGTVHKYAHEDQGKSFTAGDLKAMGLPSRIKPENVRFRANDPTTGILDIYDDIGDMKWVRVGSKIGEDGSLSAIDKEVGKDDKWSEQVKKTVGGALSLAAMFIPGFGQAIGSGLLGLTGTAAKIAGGAILGGTSSAISGGNVVRGAVAGGLGGAGGEISSALQGAGLGETAAKLATKGLVGVGKAVIQKGDPVRALLMSQIPGMNTGNTQLDGVLNLLIKTGISKNLPSKTSSPVKSSPSLASPSVSPQRVNPIQRYLGNRT